MAFTVTNALQYLQDWNASDTSTRTTRNYYKIINDANMALHNQGNYDFDQRLGMLTWAAAYNTGTVSVDVDSNVVLGSGTTWTSADTGKYIRINNDDIAYQFTYTSSAGGTISPAYKGAANVTAGTYYLTQDRQTMPTGFKSLVNPIISAVWFILQPKTMQQIQQMRMITKWVSDPQCYGFQWDIVGSDETPIPYMWVYPSPLNKRSIEFQYYRFPSLVTTGTDTFGIPGVAEPALREYMKAFLLQEQGKPEWIQQMAVARKMGDETLAAFRVNGELPTRAEWNPMTDYAGAQIIQPIYLTPTYQTVG